MKRIVLTIVVALILACAVKPVIIPFTEASFAQQEGIDIYSSPDSVTRPFSEIGLITVKHTKWGNEEISSMSIKLILKRASEINADAVILKDQKQVRKGRAVRGDFGGYYMLPDTTTARATAIKYTTDAQQ